MHKKLPNIFIFTDEYNKEIFKNKNQNIGIIYRNYSSENRENELIKIAEANEEKSNQMLDFTKDLKNTDQDYKIKLIESLWKIIYSDKSSDIYESNLMRRLTGLLYLDKKLVGDIKEKIKKKFNK